MRSSVGRHLAERTGKRVSHCRYSSGGLQNLEAIQEAGGMVDKNYLELVTAGDEGACILPCQFTEMNKKRNRLEGEYRLMFAVLEDAVSRYIGNLRCETLEQRKIFRETAQWFHRKSDPSAGIYAFESICAFLGIDADRMRKGLMSLPREEAAPRRQRHVAA
jgi:hypothetical protein